MEKRFAICSCWLAAYLALLAFGSRFGVQASVFPMLLLLGGPPVFLCLKAVQKIIQRTRVAFPTQWTAINRHDGLRSYLFDARTFDDAGIASSKREARWWLKIGM